jgi:hypothetical protein
VIIIAGGRAVMAGAGGHAEPSSRSAGDRARTSRWRGQAARPAVISGIPPWAIASAGATWAPAISSTSYSEISTRF